MSVRYKIKVSDNTSKSVSSGLSSEHNSCSICVIFAWEILESFAQAAKRILNTSRLDMLTKYSELVLCDAVICGPSAGKSKFLYNANSRERES